MTVKARRIKAEDAEGLMQPGDFKYYTLHGQTQIIGLNFICPCGCGEKGSLSFRQWRTQPHWQWDGNEDKPTLRPSVHRIEGCKWHGFLTAGEWRSV